MLATSRARLSLGAELEFRVPMLAVDDAVSLFEERARALSPSLEPDVEVQEICHRLDGLPPAIELAAARARILTPAQILERLTSRLDLLTGGVRDAPERQRTLRATIEWSYELLEADRQRIRVAGSGNSSEEASIASTMLDVKVDRDEPLGLHEQVAAELRRAIANGEAEPGDRLPPARDLAAVLGVNRNTVLRALRQLRDEGLVDFRRGRGVTVAGSSDRGAVVARTKELVAFARRHGYRRSDLVQIIETLPE